MLGVSAHAGLKLPAFFSDHMVLQQGTNVPVWGWSAPGDRVTVSFAGRERGAQADETGRWRVDLDPLSASAEARELTVRSAGEGAPLVLSDVLVGEVWLCSGQSNMEWPLEKARDAAAEVAAADYPAIRMFTGAHKVAGEPQSDVAGAWRVCRPEAAGKFSAIAYFFGRELHTTRHVPVGLIHMSCGWTPSEAWTPREALLADPATAYIAERWDRIADPQVQADYRAALEAWEKEAAAAKEAGREPPPKPKNPGDPNFIHRAAGMWNGMIAPLAPCAVRGVAWYQGETNERRGYRYRIEFPLLINAWREAWSRPDLPFLFVQVANVLPPDPVPVDSEWAELRESQALALKLPHTGMAVTIDIGEADDVHPKNKQDAGHRLALVARARVYGEDIPYSGPMFKRHRVEGDRIRILFDHTYGSLKTPGDEPLKGFAIAARDGGFVYADARIDGDSVVVWSAEVRTPADVRYAWANNPQGCNLYNAAGLPACPFRTDTRVEKTRNATGLVIDSF
jgi:sialate O-acetylesterase